MSTIVFHHQADALLPNIFILNTVGCSYKTPMIAAQSHWPLHLIVIIYATPSAMESMQQDFGRSLYATSVTHSKHSWPQLLHKNGRGFSGNYQPWLLHSYVTTLVLNLNNILESEMNNKIPILYIVCNVMMSFIIIIYN